MCWHAGLDGTPAKYRALISVMAMVHCNNAEWVPMPITHPENWLPVVENSRLFAQCAHSARGTLLICDNDALGHMTRHWVGGSNSSLMGARWSSTTSPHA